MMHRKLQILTVVIVFLNIVGCASFFRDPEANCPTSPEAVKFEGKDPRQIAREYAERNAGRPYEIIGAGDIAACDCPVFQRAMATAEVINKYPDALVFTVGDEVYTKQRWGRVTSCHYNKCYGPFWGKFRDRTLPSPGNHDDGIVPWGHSLAAYFEYHGHNAFNEGSEEDNPKCTGEGKGEDRAENVEEKRCGTKNLGYYSADLGSWHIVSLNSEMINLDKDHEAIQRQYKWLREDLEEARKGSAKCIVAIFHHSRFARTDTHHSGHGDNEKMKSLWDILMAAKTDIAITGHSHNYEVHEPKDNDGRVDKDRGIRQFVVGTGGIGDERHPEAVTLPFGVLKVTLEPAGYKWEFIQTEGGQIDEEVNPITGSGSCKVR